MIGDSPFNTMESLDIHFKDIILRNLYVSPHKKRIQYDILDELQITLFPEQLRGYRKQLVMEGLIIEENPNEIDSPIEIPPEGYQAIQIFGSYQSYIADKQDAMQMERKNEKLKLKYMKLRNINIIVTILLTFLSFIAGILLSDQVKKLLQ